MTRAELIEAMSRAAYRNLPPAEPQLRVMGLALRAFERLGLAVVPAAATADMLETALPKNDLPIEADWTAAGEAVLALDTPAHAVENGRTCGADLARDYRRLVAAGRIDQESPQ